MKSPRTIHHASGLRRSHAPRLKTAAAAALVTAGRARRNLARNLADADRRVPGAGGADHQYNDSFVFQGADADGQLFMSRLGFRGDGERAEVWMFLDLAGRKLVNLEQVVAVADSHPAAIRAGGLSYRPVGLDGRWGVRYEGRLGDGVPVEVDLLFQPRSRCYLSSEHMDSWATGQAMAEMPWSREYFRRLQSEHQVRVEQGGVLRGTVRVDGVTQRFEMLGFRDHSWGRRRWSFIRRYIWNVLALESPVLVRGEPHQFLCFTTVDYGSSFSHLVSGWMAGAEHLRPIVAASDMGRLGQDGVIPDVYELVFQPRGATPLRARVERTGVPQPWLLADGEFEVNEAYCQFTIEGVRGYGMSEFGYSRDLGVPRPCFRS